MKKAQIRLGDTVMLIEDLQVLFGGDPIKKGTHLKVVGVAMKHIEAEYKGRYFDVDKNIVRLVNPYKAKRLVVNKYIATTHAGIPTQFPKGWIGVIQALMDGGAIVSMHNTPAFVPEDAYDLYEGLLESGTIKMSPLSPGDTIEVRTPTGEDYSIAGSYRSLREGERFVVIDSDHEGAYVFSKGSKTLVKHGFFKKVYVDDTASCPVDGTETPSKPLVKDFIKVGDYVRMDVVGGVEIGGLTIMEGCAFEVTGVEDDKLQIEVFMDKFIYVPTKYFVQIPNPTEAVPDLELFKPEVETKRKPELERPERGYFPKLFWLEDRLKDIDHAINRRIASKQEIPAEWVTERNELVLAIKKEDEHGVSIPQ